MRRRRRDRTSPASAPDRPFQPPGEAGAAERASSDDRGAPATADRATGSEASGADPDGDLPTTVMSAVPADQPSAQVLSELRSFFTGHGGEVAPSAAGERAEADRPPSDRATAAPVDAAVASDEPSRGGGAAAPELQPAPTERAARRSRREAKREARREAKRVKAHAKQAKRAARKGGAAAHSGAVDAGETVRIIAEDGSAGAAPTGGDVPGGAPRGGAPAGSPAVVSIVDDGDLPEAVYLDGDVDSRIGTGAATGSPPDSAAGAGAEADAGEPARVFIDDQDRAAGAIATVDAAVAQPRIEPRLRDRRAAVQRALTRRRLKVLGAVAGAVALVVAGLGVLGSGAFAVSKIVVEGVSYSAGDQLDEIIADIDGANVLRLDTGEIEARIERIAWVGHARVSADFPNTVTIEIAERRPVSTYRSSDGRWRVLDVDGRVLSVLDGQPVGFLPIVPFDAAPNLSPGANAPRGFRGAATLARMLGGGLAEQVAQIAVDGDGTDLRMYLVGGVEVRFGAASDLIDKLVRLDLALTDPDHIPTELIDVSTQDYVVR